jgi:putative ABC transport system ATP-binding protein
LRIDRGSFVAIVGPSGAGKSTILDLLGGIETATAGSVVVDGMDLSLMNDAERAAYRREQTGFLWQGATKNLVPYLSASRNVQLPLIVSGVAGWQARERATELLELLGVSHRAGSLPEMLSGGEQQRVALATALANSPSILLADEPTAEIDTEGAERVVDALLAARDSTGATVIMATHDLIAASRADVVYRMVDGRLRSRGGVVRLDEQGRIQLPDEAARLVGAEEVEVELEAGSDEVLIRRSAGSSAAEVVASSLPTSGAVRGAGAAASLRARAFPPPPVSGRETEPSRGPASAQTPPALVSCDDLHRTFGEGSEVPALRGVDMGLSRGELVVLIGPSGSGKSTLLGLLAGLDRPTSGTVAWEGRQLHEIPEEETARLRATRFGVVFQALGLFPALSALENVVLPLLMSGSDPSSAEETARRWLVRLGLEGRMDHRVNELSAGQQQRAAVARALAPEPDLVLADEPTAELDEQASAVILSALHEVAARGGGVMVTTHDPSVLKRANRVIVLRDGKIEAQGSLEEVAAHLTTD